MNLLTLLRHRGERAEPLSADDERFAMAQLEAAQRRDPLVAGAGDGTLRRGRRARH
jgi:hypothetical protein